MPTRLSTTPKGRLSGRIGSARMGGRALRLGVALLLSSLGGVRCSPAQLAGYFSGESQGAIPRALTSHSGQFLVHSAALAPLRPAMADLVTNQNYILLDPMFLPVSCDRIKQSLDRQLGDNSRWNNRIYITLRTAGSVVDPITITSDRFRDGWRYLVELPNLVERSRYVRAVTQVLLLEMANRGASERAAEIPAWLAEGCARKLLAGTNSELEIILPAPAAGISGFRAASVEVDATRGDPLFEARKWLRAATPLTFQELSWPTPEQLEGGQAEVFGSSAQLFVTQLLALPDGPASLRAMLASLPGYYNWQFAFLHSFQAHFQRPLDVEKWWALQVVHFTGREMGQTWPAEESWRKLDEVVRSGVQVWVSTNQLPLQGEAPLQTIIREWTPQRQTQVLQAKINQLNSLRLRLAPEFVSLADEYRDTLAAYLAARDRHSILGLGKGSSRRRASEDALRQLDASDARRAAMPGAPRTVSAPPPTGT